MLKTAIANKVLNQTSQLKSGLALKITNMFVAITTTSDTLDHTLLQTEVSQDASRTGMLNLRLEDRIDNMAATDQALNIIAKEVIHKKYQNQLIYMDIIIAISASILIFITLMEVNINLLLIQQQSQRFNQCLDIMDTQIQIYRLLLLGIGSLTSVLLIRRNNILVSKWYYQERVRSRNCLETKIRKWSIIKISLEIIIAVMFPLPYADIEFSVYSNSLQAYKTYNLDQILSMLSLLKCYFIFRLVPHLTALKSDLSRKVFELNGVPVDNALFAKVQLRERPVLILSAMLTLGTVFFGVAVQIYERGLQTLEYLIANASDPYSTISNAMWSVTLGMTTVGYGDIVPVTNIGRLIMVCACFSGMFITTLIIVTIQRMINHNEKENNAYLFIINFQNRYLLRSYAASVIQRHFQYNRRFGQSADIQRTQILQTEGTMLEKSVLPQESTIKLKMKLQEAIEKYREYRQIWIGGGEGQQSIASANKELVRDIDRTRIIKFSEVKGIIPNKIEETSIILGRMKPYFEPMVYFGEEMKYNSDIMIRALQSKRLKQITNAKIAHSISKSRNESKLRQLETQIDINIQEQTQIIQVEEEHSGQQQSFEQQGNDPLYSHQRPDEDLTTPILEQEPTIEPIPEKSRKKKKKKRVVTIQEAVVDSQMQEEVKEEVSQLKELPALYQNIEVIKLLNYKINQGIPESSQRYQYPTQQNQYQQNPGFLQQHQDHHSISVHTDIGQNCHSQLSHYDNPALWADQRASEFKMHKDSAQPLYSFESEWTQSRNNLRQIEHNMKPLVSIIDSMKSPLQNFNIMTAKPPRFPDLFSYNSLINRQTTPSIQATFCKLNKDNVEVAPGSLMQQLQNIRDIKQSKMVDELTDNQMTRKIGINRLLGDHYGRK